MTNKTFTVDVQVTWHPNQIPPRCRKPHPIPETDRVTIEVPAYEVEETPVVARIHSDFGIGVHGVDASEVRCQRPLLRLAPGPRRLSRHRQLFAHQHHALQLAQRLLSGIGARGPFAGMGIIGEQMEQDQ